MQQYKKQVTKFSILQWFFWSSWATYGAYLVYYLTDMGYSNIEIGAIISVRTFMGLIGEPILGYLSDIYNTNKKLFILGMIAIALVVLPFPYYNWYFILISTAVIGFFWAPQQSILDSWILKSSEKLASNYGFMRAWGSLGFAIVAAILIMASITAFYISDAPHKNKIVQNVSQNDGFSGQESNTGENYEKDSTNQQNNRNPLILFKNIEYTMILISAILVFIPNSIIFTYLPNFIKGVGGTTTLLGIVMFLNAVSEAPIFFFGKKMLVKFKPIPLLLLSTIFYLIRVIVVYEAVSKFNFLVFGVLQSLSFGILLITARFHINFLAPEHLKTTAQSIFTMSIFGIGGIIASMSGGVIMDIYGMEVLYQISIILCLSGILLMLILNLYRKFNGD